MSTKGVVYILKNPSFSEYVKIGYADDVEKRVKKLNSSECTPFGFRIHATYEVEDRLDDLKIHKMIDSINPNLRSVDNIGGKKRVREFYAMTPQTAYTILETIAELSGRRDKLHLMEPSDEELADEEVAQDIEAQRFERMSPFAFSKCNIPIGSEITFVHRKNPNSGERCIVADDKNVEYKGERISLSALATRLTESKWGVAGPRYFQYQGEWLNDIRARVEGGQADA